MTKRQNAILSMWEAVMATFHQFSEAVTSNPGFSRRAASFEKIYAQLDFNCKEQIRLATEAIQRKEQLRQLLERQGYIIATNIRNSALASGNLQLAEDMDFSKSAMYTMSGSQLAQFLSLIADTAKQTPGSTTGPGSASGNLEEYRNLLDQYFDALGSTRNAFNNRRNAARAITDTITQGREILLDMDKYIHHVESSHPDFLKAYFKARAFVDLDRLQSIRRHHSA